jgi:eukaryotic-like serine/threonine-protein kinase
MQVSESASCSHCGSGEAPFGSPRLCVVCRASCPRGKTDRARAWCPVCAARAALDSGPTDESAGPQIPEQIGPYPIVDVLGEGGFGIVYLALDPSTDGRVALKRTRLPIGDEKARKAFRREVALYEKLGSLPNVVGIRSAGDDHGYAYLTMPVMEGGSLRARMGEFRDPEAAARLMVVLARAVDAIHTSTPPVLHRDLKPENVLFDRHGRPHVSDFGIAKIGTEIGFTREEFGVGCPHYSAPEQILPEYGDLTPAADVYSLGAIFYELLTGSVPHRGKTADEVLRRIVSEEPIPPRQLRPELDRDWETICMHALGRADSRYPSAAHFADDLENALARRPLLARPSSRLDRLRRLRRRHPTASRLTVVSALLAISLLSFELWTRQAEASREERRQKHAASLTQFSASAQAGALLFQLSQYAERVRAAAKDPELVALAREPGNVSPRHPALLRHLGPFDSLLVLDTAGRPHAHSRDASKAYFGRSFAFREYFQAARALSESCPHAVHLAPAFRSEEDNQIKFPLAAPLVDAAGQWVGVLMAGTIAAPGLGEVELQDPDGEQLTILLGPRGAERDNQEARADFTFLVHPELPSSREYQLAEPERALLERHFAFAPDPCHQFELVRRTPLILTSYTDPLPGFAGTWLAAVAPVGRTGYFVVVQSRPERAN